ncbi:zinc-ribbon domain-containing protein [Cohnella suwonensis]|uniref:Zinc-ribbon domain-containing protein n=1 Tax=Cohnella suwonensis TaxID=696072 RepID=A0ABW0LXY6_9BACL
MFCSHCGVKLSDQSKFCNHCGTSVPAIPTQEFDVLVQESAAAAESVQQLQSVQVQSISSNPIQHAIERNAATAGKTKLRPLHWIMPLVCLIVSVALIAGVYFYQKSVNRNVEDLLQEGEALALEGKWSESLAAIEKALKQRPEHSVLLKDQALLTEVIAMDKTLKDTEQQVKVKKYNEAGKTIHTLQEQLNVRSGPLIELLALNADKQEEHIVVAQAAHDASSKDKIEELMPLFNAIKDYDSKEAVQAIEEIKGKLIDLTHEKAMSELKSNNFSIALDTAEEGLKLDGDSTKLNELKKTIEAQKKKFEEAETKRIQKAREAATLEDQINKTAAVELIFADGYYEEGTDYFNVEINVKNVATRPISSILIYYDLLDEYGNIMDSSSSYVQPDVLDVGESSSAYNYHYSDGSIASVNVTYFEWYIN